MDQKKIEEGLRRLERAAQEEREQKKLKEQQEEEKAVHEKAVNVLSEEEEEKQNVDLKVRFPDDICPCCKVHVVDARYLVIPMVMGAIVCGNCGNMFMPKSRKDQAIEALERLKASADSNIVVPKAAIPAIKS